MKPLSKLNPAITYRFNILNLILLRDHFVWLKSKEANPDVGFHMNYYLTNTNEGNDKSGHSCGTIACIAGHAVLVSGQKGFIQSYFNKAKRWLGLTEEEAVYLFNGSFTRKCIQDITLEDGILQLNHMIETGEVN